MAKPSLPGVGGEKGTAVLVWRGKSALMAVCLAACAPGGTTNPVHSVYGAFARDGTVDLPHHGLSQEFHIRLGRTEPKINVQLAVMGAVSLNIFRPVGLARNPDPAVFEHAAMTFLNAKKGSGCHLSRPVQVADTEWEFDYECPAARPR